jgi:hypothetical protein
MAVLTLYSGHGGSLKSEHIEKLRASHQPENERGAEASRPQNLRMYGRSARPHHRYVLATKGIRVTLYTYILDCDFRSECGCDYKATGNGLAQ